MYEKKVEEKVTFIGDLDPLADPPFGAACFIWPL